MTVVYIVRKMTSSPMVMASMIIALMKDSRPGIFGRGHQGEIVLERPDGYSGKEVAHVFHHILGVFGTCTFHKEDACLVPRAH